MSKRRNNYHVRLPSMLCANRSLETEITILAWEMQRTYCVVFFVFYGITKNYKKLKIIFRVVNALS